MKKLLVLGLFVSVASAHALVVDNFTTGAYNSGYLSAGTANAWTPAPGVSGGMRATFVTIQANPLGGDARLRVQNAFGVLQVSSEADVDSNLQLAYGFSSGSTTVGSNPLNLDYSFSPLVQVTVRSNDVAMPASVTLFTNNGASSFTRALTIAGGITPASPQVISFDFTSDVASLNDVDAMIFTFDAAPDGDYALTNINVVPEPASMIALGLGAAAMIRRRKKNS